MRRTTEGDILNVERHESKSQEVTAKDWTERNLYFNMPATEETQPKVEDGMYTTRPHQRKPR